MKKDYRRIILILFLVTVVLSGLYFFWVLFAKEPIVQAFGNRAELVQFVQEKGALGPVFYILLQIFQTIVAPIPGNIVGAVGGFLFGPLGILWTTIGSAIGVSVVFLIARRFGRKLVLKLVNKKHLGKFDKIPEDKAGFTFFLFFLIPGLPDDVISYAAGLSKVPIPKLIILWIVGRMPAVVVTNYIGMGVEEGELGKVIILLALSAIIVAVFALESKKITDYLEKSSKKKRAIGAKSRAKTGSKAKKRG